MSATPQGPIHSIADAFRRQAARSGGRVALECGSQRLTYGELDARSDALAARLAAHGVSRGARVGLLAHRGVDAIVGILATLKAGGAYLPLDPAQPPRVLQQMQDDAQPLVTLATAGLVGLAPRSDNPVLLLGPEMPAAAPAVEASPEDPAYVMYTSGSTGTPKGVLVPQRGVLRLVLDPDYVQLGADQTLLQMSPLGFDASTFEIWGALLNGGRLAILPVAQPSLDDLAAAIARHGVSTLWLTAGLFHLMVEQRLQALAPLRQLLAGGDVLSPRHCDTLLRAYPHLSLVNGYGPTENTTFSCCHTVQRGRDPSLALPIGRPIRGTFVHVLDEGLQPATEGELFVGGEGLALGYLRRPELNAQRFVEIGGQRLYRTGDRVRWNAQGELEFLGRTDRQVKISGKRVELDGVEAALRATGLVAEAAAIAVGDDASRRSLWAFVAPKPGAVLDLAALRAALARELPDYMRPSQVESLAALPLNANGKVDRGALTERVRRAAAAPPPPRPVAAPAAGTEAQLLAIWREALGRNDVGLDQNFFDLGGSSLQLMRVHAAIQARLRRDVALVDLFAHPRIRMLAKFIDGAPRRAPDSVPAARAVAP
ncbi:MAG TPA: non-ribosomal peptide synthetase [Candidatus Binatia bacterium]|nr:non-ribosomal peptide synthetase [Candidatus Binatia bacterium]